MMSYAPGPRHPLQSVTLMPASYECRPWHNDEVGAPTSGAWSTASKARFYPIHLYDPYVVAKMWWLNGATAATDSIDVGVYSMTDLVTGRCDLIRSCGGVLASGANVVQEAATTKVARANLTSGNDSTDSTTYTTASVTLKAGRLYLLSVVNTAASAAALSSVASGPTFTSRSSTQFNTTAHRVSIWSAVPTVDYTGTLVITFGATQTGCCWVLDEMSGVDTATTHGIVQQAVGTGNSTTPLATLAAFGSANNATYGAHGVANTSTAAPGAGFTELAEATAATPASRVETEWRVDNDTTVDATVTSGQWGSCAVEIKADASPFVIPASTPGVPNLYLAMSVNGTTTTTFRNAPGRVSVGQLGHLEKTSTYPLPSSVIPVAITDGHLPVFGVSARSLLA